MKRCIGIIRMVEEIGMKSRNNARLSALSIMVAIAVLAPFMATAPCFAEPESSLVTVNYVYDDLNRLTYVGYSSGLQIVYVYDEVGNRTQRIVSTGTPHQWTQASVVGAAHGSLSDVLNTLLTLLTPAGVIILIKRRARRQ